MGYPKAALFGFCMALVTYNSPSVVRAAVRVVHGDEAARSLSTYYLATEVASTHVGLSIILDASFWNNKYATLTPMQMANELKRLAGNMWLAKYKKAKRTPPTPSTKRTMNKEKRNHVSTARVLQESRRKTTGST